MRSDRFIQGKHYIPSQTNFIIDFTGRLATGQVSVSDEVSLLVKLLSRGDTTVVDACLSPILRRYVDGIANEIAGNATDATRLMFMQSNGALTVLLLSGQYPARNPRQNMTDMSAQIADNEKGVQELRKMVGHFTLDTVNAYMRHVQDNADYASKIPFLPGRQFAYDKPDT